MRKDPDFAIPTYDGHQFGWRGRMGVTSASDLAVPPGHAPGQRVWADAADVGFYVNGYYETKLFTLEGSDGTNDHGDVLGWHFVAEDGTRIHIYND